MEEKLVKVINKFENQNISDNKLKKYINIFTNVSGSNIIYLINFISIIERYYPYETIRLFGDKYWIYAEFYSIHYPTSTKFLSSKQFNNQIEELEYFIKLVLVYGDTSYDLSLPIHKILLNLTICHGFGFVKIAQIFIHKFAKFSVDFLLFAHEYILEYPKRKKEALDTLKEIFSVNDIKPAEILEVAELLKQFTYEDMNMFDNNIFKYFRMMNHPKILAMRTFIDQLDIACDLDDNEDITISKSSIKPIAALIRSAH